MSIGNLTRDCFTEGSVRDLKKKLNETFRSLKSTIVNRNTRPIRLGARRSAIGFSLGLAIAIVLLGLTGPGRAASPQPISLEVTLPWPKDASADKRKIKLVLYAPEISELGKDYKDWYRLSIMIGPEIIKEFPRVSGDAGEGLFLSLEDPGSIVLAVDDTKAFFGDKEIHYKQTDGLSENPKEYSGKLGKQYKSPEVTVDPERKAKSEFLIAVSPAGVVLSFQLGGGLLKYEFDWALTTSGPAVTDAQGNKTAGTYSESSLHKEAGTPFSPHESRRKYDHQTMVWEMLCTPAEAKVSSDQGYEINYCFYLGRENPESADLWIRTVIPYRWVGGTLGDQIEDVKHVEIEWKVELPGTPPAPSGMVSTAVCFPRVDLTWKDNSTNEEGFHVYRKSTGDYARVASVPVDATSYSDTTNPQTTYRYQVTAYNEIGESPASTGILVTTLPAPAKTQLVFRSAFDDHYEKDLSGYRVHVKLNGRLIFSGRPPEIEHGKPSGRDFTNFRDFEILFSTSLLRFDLQNEVKVGLSGVGDPGWFCWDYITVGCAEFESRKKMQPYSPTQVDGVHEGKFEQFFFDFRPDLFLRPGEARKCK